MLTCDLGVVDVCEGRVGVVGFRLFPSSLFLKGLLEQGTLPSSLSSEVHTRVFTNNDDSIFFKESRSPSSAVESLHCAQVKGKPMVLESNTSRTNATTVTYRLYQALDLSISASSADIRRSYRRVALLTHPDRIAPGGEARMNRMGLLTWFLPYLTCL